VGFAKINFFPTNYQGIRCCKHNNERKYLNIINLLRLGWDRTGD